MGFIKNVIVYESEKTKIYINECHNKGKKTRLFCVRRDDKTGLADLLGIIKFSGAWRQYVFYPDKDTVWSAGCLNEIISFCQNMTQKWREKLKKSRKQKDV